MAKQAAPECDSVRNHLMSYLKGELEEATREKIEAHLAGCPGCRTEMEAACRVLAITDAASEPAVDRTVDDLLREVIRRGSSDIHLEPTRDGMRVRLREDGLIRPHSAIPPPLHQAVLHRLKLRAGMDLTETRRPQQGRFKLEHDGTAFEIRAGTLLSLWGERMTLRILRQFHLPTLEEIAPMELETLRRWNRTPSGLILVAGRPGSGKVTTAYSLLQDAAGPEVNAMAVGSSTPFVMEDVSQTDLMGARGMTAAEAVRAIYTHQDPDILMIEEIDGEEIAREAMELALTGHLVISCMEAKTGAVAARRMIDFGSEPGSLAEALIGIVAQRLVRKSCSECAAPADPALLDRLGLPAATEIRRSPGCDACKNSGWKGRVALYSLSDFSGGRLRSLPVDVSREDLLKAVHDSEVKTLRQSAAEAVRSGSTTSEEALRVLEAAE